MYNIRAPCLGKAHELVIKKILQQGKYLKTEDGELTLELLEPLNIHVSSPFDGYMISPYNMFGDKAMKQYVHDLLCGTGNDFSYTYHDRLFDFPTKDSKGEDCGDGFKGGIDQIEGIIQKLSNNSSSRRAQGITWYPPKDLDSGNPPCLQRIQGLVRDDAFNMYVEFRSNDMLSALGANMYALVHLQKYIADHLNLDLGWYSHTSVSAHLYYKRDYEELIRYIEGLKLNSQFELLQKTLKNL